MADSRPRTPGLVYAVVAVAILVLLASFALTQRTPPPPTIAEFAPQAVEQITDSPTDQTSKSGTGRGTGAGGSEAEPTPAPASAPVDVARVRRCVGDPPRQIEDQQSPPCVPYWTGDNGGATWRGVTRDQIRIVQPVSTTDNVEWMEHIFAFFNSRFEFYGRKLTLVPMKIEGEGDATTVSAYAVRADEEHDAFASLTYSQDNAKGSQGAYYDELATRKIVSASFLANYQPEGHLERFAPYQWQYVPSVAEFGRHQGEWMCEALAGRPARYGGPGTAGRPRVFGLVSEKASRNGADYPNLTTLRQHLRACGAEAAVDLQSDGSPTAGQNIVLQMAAHNPPVTTILCVCDGSGQFGTFIQKPASAQQYYPEWLISNYVYMEHGFNVRAFNPADQAEHQFGITFVNKLRHSENMPVYWASAESGTNEEGGGYEIGFYAYENLLQIASGIQMAGPILTPQNFEAGMFKARFPNPGCKRGPQYQACVDYGAGDHVMQDDTQLIWWSNTIREHSSGLTGTYCYVREGERYARGEYPTSDDGLFGQECQDN